ncbi:hypothetical protein GIB67_028426 [Kingdonia uniflora]|uniref:Uncharacterized protein n=1 Tax=Kingdonia uniflora TaxID=39325 RepID=A0A7J7MC71_9MAGN|nr:hypothetical protein GIB67_028426 [Kingdonia uniflora]
MDTIFLHKYALETFPDWVNYSFFSYLWERLNFPNLYGVKREIFVSSLIISALCFHTLSHTQSVITQP